MSFIEVRHVVVFDILIENLSRLSYQKHLFSYHLPQASLDRVASVNAGRWPLRTPNEQDHILYHSVWKLPHNNCPKSLSCAVLAEGTAIFIQPKFRYCVRNGCNFLLMNYVHNFTSKTSNTVP